MEGLYRFGIGGTQANMCVRIIGRHQVRPAVQPVFRISLSKPDCRLPRGPDGKAQEAQERNHKIRQPLAGPAPGWKHDRSSPHYTRRLSKPKDTQTVDISRTAHYELRIIGRKSRACSLQSVYMPHLNQWLSAVLSTVSAWLRTWHDCAGAGLASAFLAGLGWSIAACFRRRRLVITLTKGI